MRHLIVPEDLTAHEIEAVFAVSRDLEEKYDAGRRDALLPGRVMALVFEKPSLRTRVSFEAAMVHLGGSSLFLGDDAGFSSSRESIADFGRVLSEYVDVIVCRSKAHASIEQLAAAASVPVINGLSDSCHPCQALADIYTLNQHVGRVAGHTLAFVGDGNNVARSLAVLCGLRGMRVVYTDVGTSMGQEKERQQRTSDLRPYQVNEALMKHCPDALFMHCLPARRGEEVTDGVIDGPQSVVVEEAANRMHVQKGLLAWLLGPQK